jgi:hypothetical protein
MNSSDNTLQTLVLIPIVAALVGIFLMIGITMLPKPAGSSLSVQAVELRGGEKSSRSGDGLHSFNVAHPQGSYESYTL